MAPLRLMLGVCVLAIAAPAAAEPDFSGTWERYPPPGETADPRYAPTIRRAGAP